MDRAHRDRFERLQASAGTLAADLRALDSQVVEAMTSADEVDRAAEAHRKALDATTCADDELRTAMVRMEARTAWAACLILGAVGGAYLGFLPAWLVMGKATDESMAWGWCGGGFGFCLGGAWAIAASYLPAVRYARQAAAARRKAVGVRLLPGPIPVPIVARGEATLESLERYVSALEAGVTERVAFLQAERARKSLTGAEVERLELLLQRGAAHRADLERLYKSAEFDRSEWLRKQGEQSGGDYYA